MPFSSYQYEPLQEGEIRLLKLFPGQFDDEISTEITHATLSADDSLIYEALSHAWDDGKIPEHIYVVLDPDLGAGDQPATDNSTESMVRGAATRTVRPLHDIRRNGEDKIDPLQKLTLQQAEDHKRRFEMKSSISVTPNLASALRHLRKVDTARILWIDAICIDQQNLDERSVQVNRMAEIYASAQNVVIWIGPSGDESQLALETIDRIGRNVKFNYAKLTFRAKSGHEASIVDQEMDKCFDCCYADTTKRSIESLFSRAWFGRLWIWQELYRAREALLVCGSQQLEWETVSNAVGCLRLQVGRIQRNHPGRELIFQSILQKMDRAGDLVRQRFLGSRSLLNLLRSSQHAECRDPRDRIYSLLGMLSERQRAAIKPDYTKGIPEIYTNAALSIASHTQSIHMLQDCGERVGQSISDLPSWVPNWSVAQNCASLGENNGSFNAAGSSRPATTTQEQGVLPVLGVYCATVVSTSPIIPLTASAMEIISLWRHWSSSDNCAQAYRNCGSLFEAYCKIFILGETKDRVRREYRQFEALADVKAILNMDDCSNTNASMLNLTKSQRKILAKITSVTAGRKFATISEGYVGLVPSNSMPGDHVCVFLGLRMPIILRPDGYGYFAVVGTCYIEGLMDSEGLLGPLPLGWRVEIDLNLTKHGKRCVFYINEETASKSRHDPRLWELPEDWCVEFDNGGALQFKNRRTSKCTGKDPRLTSEELKKHGVDIRTFQLK